MEITDEFEKALDSKGSFRTNPDIDHEKLIKKTLPAENNKEKAEEDT